MIRRNLPPWVNKQSYGSINLQPFSPTLFFFSKKYRKNKVRALFGNWTNCFYSCDANSYDSYTKSSKALPMAEFDQHLNQLSSPVANFGKFNNTLDNNNFDVNSIDANETGVSKFSSNKPKFTLNGGGTGESEYTAVEKLEKMDRLGDDLQRNLNLNRVSDLKNTVSLPANLNSPIKDLTELWITRPRPAYSNEVCSIGLATKPTNAVVALFNPSYILSF
jgi:hypothetical protein